MIDLTKKALPNTVVVNGKAYSIYTDFRVWLKFEIAVSRMRRDSSIPIDYLFKNEVPLGCDVRELFVFSRPENVLPRSIRQSNVIALDYEIDADLIYSAFLGQYGIDLVDVQELHWHKFLALLNGINSSTKLREIIGYRCYEKDNRKDIDHMEELRYAWEIERPLSEAEEQELQEFSDIFERKS